MNKDERIEAAIKLPEEPYQPYTNTNYQMIWRRGWLDCKRAVSEALADEGSDAGMEVDVHEVVAWAALIDSLEGAAGGSPGERAIMIAHAILEADPDDGTGEPPCPKHTKGNGPCYCQPPDNTPNRDALEALEAFAHAAFRGDAMTADQINDRANAIRRHLTAPPENLPHFDYRKGPEDCTEVVRRSTYTCPYCNNKVEVDSGPETAPPTVPEDIVESMKWLAERYVANFGHSEQFVSCITPGNDHESPYYQHWDKVRRYFENEHAIVQHSEPGRVPEGWRPAPVEPTDEMLDVTVVAAGDSSAVSVVRQRHREIYRAMIAAAPAPDADERE